MYHIANIVLCNIYSYLWKRLLYIDLEINLCNPGSMCISESVDTGHSIYLQRVTFLTVLQCILRLYLRAATVYKTAYLHYNNYYMCHEYAYGSISLILNLVI